MPTPPPSGDSASEEEVLETARGASEGSLVTIRSTLPAPVSSIPQLYPAGLEHPMWIGYAILEQLSPQVRATVLEGRNETAEGYKLEEEAVLQPSDNPSDNDSHYATNEQGVDHHWFLRLPNSNGIHWHQTQQYPRLHRFVTLFAQIVLTSPYFQTLEAYVPWTMVVNEINQLVPERRFGRIEGWAFLSGVECLSDVREPFLRNNMILRTLPGGKGYAVKMVDKQEPVMFPRSVEVDREAALKRLEGGSPTPTYQIKTRTYARE